MRTISIRMPDSLHRQAKALAARDGIALNQFVVLALAEKVFAVVSHEDREVRAAQGAEDIRDLFPDIAWPDDPTSDDATR
jgi:hypothetical protein